MHVIETYNLYIVLKNLVEFLYKRFQKRIATGFSLKSFIEFYTTASGKLADQTLSFNVRDNVWCFVYQRKFGITDARDLLKLLNEQKIEYAILLYKENISSFAKKFISKLPVTVELFTHADFICDPTNSIYACKSSKKIKTNKKKVIKVLQSDPIVKYYGWKQGDLIEYNRPLPNGNTFKICRKVK